MTLVDDIARRGVAAAREKAKTSARRAAASAALWVLCLVFFCTAVGFGAVATFIALSAVIGPVLSGLAIAAAALALTLLTAVLALPDDMNDQPEEQERPEGAQASVPPQDLPAIICAGFVSGFLESATDSVRQNRSNTSARR